MDTCKISSATLAYRIFGSPSPDSDFGLLVVIDTCLASCSAEWWHIAERLADHCRVLVYDRAGYGQSSASTRERTPENVARELDELLTRLEDQERLLLVGHSQGGFYLTQYALMFPAKVQALILLDPATPYDGEFRQRLLPGEYKNSGVDKTFTYKLAKTITSMGLGFLFKPMLAKSPPFYYHDFSAEAKKYLLTALCKSRTYKTALEEYRYTHLDSATRRVKDGIDNQGLVDLPVVLLTHGSAFYIRELQQYGEMDETIAAKVETLWQELMLRYLKLSANSRHIVAPNSGHYIHLTDGELVETAIRSF